MTAVVRKLAPRESDVAARESDEALIAAVAGGQLEALGLLFDRFEPTIFRYVQRLGVSGADADDLVQATFLEVTRAAPRFDVNLSAKSWLLGVATILVRRHRRSFARSAARVLAWAHFGYESEQAPSAHDELERNEEQRRFREALDKLSPKKREVFALVVLEEMRGEDAARVLGVPVNTVWTRLHHARRELRSLLETP
jgi:RNA polymerase sigma-70 factor (ECF subfamily)